MAVRVEKEQVNVKINKIVTSHEVIQQDANRYIIKLNLFKGQSLIAPESFASGLLKMIRTKVQITGDLRKYVTLDSAVAKDIVESMDIDLKLIEQFFYKFYSKQAITSKLSSIVEHYEVSRVGSYIGSITLDYDQFSQFVLFLKIGAYEPIKNNSVFG